jgi:hypothetical protein
MSTLFDKSTFRPCEEKRRSALPMLLGCLKQVPIVPGTLCLFYHFSPRLGQVSKEVTSMANVHGIEFSSNQSDLVKGLIRELLKDGNCAVYALPHMKPNGELRMALKFKCQAGLNLSVVFKKVSLDLTAGLSIRESAW